MNGITPHVFELFMSMNFTINCIHKVCWINLSDEYSSHDHKSWAMSSKTIEEIEESLTKRQNYHQHTQKKYEFSMEITEFVTDVICMHVCRRERKFLMINTEFTFCFVMASSQLCLINARCRALSTAHHLICD